MNRITKKEISVGGKEKVCCTHFGGLTCYQFTGHCSSGCPYEEQAWEKLAAYEDTGLEPGEIVAVLKGVAPGARIFTLVQDNPQFYPETNGWYVSADTVGAIGIGGFYYDRFMDDFCMIHPDKKFLQNLLKEITAYMKSKGLELNEKTGIFPLRNGIDFLGFHSYLDDNGGVVQKLGKLGLERFKRAIRYWQVAYPAGEVTRDEIIVSFTGMDAHAAFGDTYSLRKKFAAQVGEIIGGKVPIHRKINSTRIVRAKRQIREAQRLFKSKHKADGELHSAKSSHEIPPWEEVCPEITDW